MPLEEFDDLLLRQTAVRNTERHFLKLIIARSKFKTVHQKKQFGRDNGHTLIPVNKRVSRAQVKMIGSSLRTDTLVKKFTAKCRPRHRNRRLQKAPITKPMVTAKLIDDP